MDKQLNKSRIKKQLLLLGTTFLLVIFFQKTPAQVRLPHLIRDSMVLQRDTKLKLWGWATAGENVSVTFNKKTFKTKTGVDGKWQLTLPPVKAGGPYTMKIDATNHLTLNSI